MKHEFSCPGWAWARVCVRERGPGLVALLELIKKCVYVKRFTYFEREGVKHCLSEGGDVEMEDLQAQALQRRYQLEELTARSFVRERAEKHVRASGQLDLHFC